MMLVFDFDGVIADSHEAVLHAVNALAVAKGVPPVTATALRERSLPELFRHFKVRWYQIPWYVRMGRQHMQAFRHLINVHAQVLPTFAWAQGQGLRVAILSSNSADLIRGVVAEHLPTVAFQEIVGKVSLFSKHRALKKLMQRQRLRPSDLVYVGDEVRDIAAAHRVGVRSIAVTWGKDNAALLAAARPTFQVGTADGLLGVVQGLGRSA